MNRTLFIIALLSFHSASFANAQSADEILAKTDEIRSPSGSYRMRVAVESSDQARFEFDLKIGGKDASLIRTLEPKREIGKNYLMLGEDMWAYIPNIRRSVRISLNQKLTGQASHGDISRMRWHGDYEAQIESQDGASWALMLNAKKQGLTYDKIRVWVSKANFYPIKGEYLTRQGAPLKLIDFEQFSEFSGTIRPSVMKITSAIKSTDVSYLRIVEMSEAQFPSSVFSQDSLK